MLPADIEPWVWIPFSRRRGFGLSTILVAVAAATAGYVMGQWHTTIVAQPQKTVAAPPQVANNSQAKGAASEPDLALKSDGESKKEIPAVTQTKPEAPAPVLLNPGTADPKSVQARGSTGESRAAPGRVGGEGTADLGNNRPRDEPAAGSRNSMRDYRDLRDYMMRP